MISNKKMKYYKCNNRASKLVNTCYKNVIHTLVKKNRLERYMDPKRYT